MEPAGLSLTALTLICWVISLYKLRDLARNTANMPQRLLVLAQLAITLALTIRRVDPQLDHLLAMPGVTETAAICLTLLFTAGVQGCLLYLASSATVEVHRRVRRRFLGTAGAIALVLTFYVLARPHDSLGHARGGTDQVPTLAVLTGLGYLGWSMGQIAVLAFRYARLPLRPLARLGLRLSTLGALSGVGHVVLAAASLVLRNPATRSGSAALLAVSILSIVIGSTLPSWGPYLWLDRLYQWGPLPTSPCGSGHCGPPSTRWSPTLPCCRATTGFRHGPPLPVRCRYAGSGCRWRSSTGTTPCSPGCPRGSQQRPGPTVTGQGCEGHSWRWPSKRRSWPPRCGPANTRSRPLPIPSR